MGKTIKTDIGHIEISNDVICSIAGLAATTCYGLVGMASRTFQDGIAVLLGKENLSKGIEIEIKDNSVRLRLFIIVEYGIRITEVAKNVCEKVKFVVEDSTGMTVEDINIIVQGVRVGTSGKEKSR